MNSKIIIVLSAVVAVSIAQRSPYAGRRPIGYPVIETPAQNENDLGNRLGDSVTGDSVSTPSTTTIRLPVEALGDRDFFNSLAKLPLDKQPFWYINWKQLEAQRKRPQTYHHKINTFIDGSSNSAFFLQ